MNRLLSSQEPLKWSVINRLDMIQIHDAVDPQGQASEIAHFCEGVFHAHRALHFGGRSVFKFNRIDGNKNGTTPGGKAGSGKEAVY